jgi:hypothetical protein
MAQRRPSGPEPVEPPLRPRLADQPSRFVLREREGGCGRCQQERRPLQDLLGRGTQAHLQRDPENG